VRIKEAAVNAPTVPISFTLVATFEGKRNSAIVSAM
jgi:hypothetical protein